MNYHNITKDDMLNGDGLRVVLWVAGCNHHCHNCQNPITWNPDGGLEFDESAESEIYTELEKEHVSGITFSGGDPLHPENREMIAFLAEQIKNQFPNKTIWLYTGYLYEQVKDLPVMQYIDVLVDGEFIEGLADINYPWAGSHNQRIIDIRKTREKGDVVLYESK